MFRINMYKIYVSLITIVLLTSQVQATCLFCSNKKPTIYDTMPLLTKVTPVNLALQKQMPQVVKERFVEELPLPALFIAPTQKTFKLLDEIYQQDENQVLAVYAKQFALQKLAM